MTSAALHAARFAPVSDAELLRAKEQFIKESMAKLLKTDLIGLFAMLNGDESEFLHKLMDGSMLDLIELQSRFKLRMQHEARMVAERDWNQFEASRAILAIQDNVGDIRG